MSETTAAIPHHLEPLYHHLEPPLEEAAVAVAADDQAATRYLWRSGSYRCGITAYLIFFLLGEFIGHARRMRPQRFENPSAFARSFDRTDRFIKAVTDSGRPASGGLTNPKVGALLRSVYAQHQAIAVPHWMMVHFGFTLIEQVEADVGEHDAALRAAHLRYMAQAYRLMGIPFSDDRTLMEQLCREIETACVRWEPYVAEYAQRLLLLGMLTGVRPQRERLRALLPTTVQPVFDAHFEAMRPRLPARGAGRLLRIAWWPVQRWRNPRAGERPAGQAATPEPTS